MRKQNKRALYESIIRDVAKVVKRRLNEGLYDFDSTSSYDDVDEILYGNKYEIIDKKPVDGLRRVKREVDGKYNFINVDGKLIFDEWFYYCNPFNADFLKGYALVQVEKDLYNYINKDGQFLSNEHFNYCTHFYPGGWAMVMATVGDKYMHNLHNVIDNQGRVVFNEWFGSTKRLFDAVHKIEHKLSKNNIIDYRFNN